MDAMTITGATRLFPIIGFPVSGVFSPPAFNAFFAARSIDAVMVGLDIAPAGLDAFWTLLRNSHNMQGCSITYPHKQAAFRAVDAMTDRAARLGALNTIKREANGKLVGEATDGLAMLSAMHKAGVDCKGRHAHIVGAGGGAGLAIVDCLCENGIAALTLEETDVERRSQLMALLKEHWPQVTISAGGRPDILINATTNGKSPADAPLFGQDTIEQCNIVCDVVTAKTETPLVASARRAFKPTVDGSAMGAEQIPVQAGFLGLHAG